MSLTDGFLNLLKPPGMTSHEVVQVVRRQINPRRAGHLGTLDPAAAGVLPISLGGATRLFRFAAGADKAYRAEVIFGTTTDTLDAEGRVTGQSDAGRLTAEAVAEALERFRGQITQRAPAYSAVQVDGKRLHQLARRGTPTEGPERQVTIFDLQLVSFRPGPAAAAVLDVVCSPGTYIRSLAADLGKALGCGAYLGFLVRTRAGLFRLSDALTLEELSMAVAEGSSGDCIIPPDAPLGHLPRVAVDARHARVFAHGGRVLVESEPKPLVRVYGPEDRFLGLGEVGEGGQLKPNLVLASTEEDG